MAGATYAATLEAFIDFLTVYVHTLLYLRRLYPRRSFVHARFHNTSVYQSRHPLVCDWISDAIDAVRNELFQSAVSRIGVVVFSYGHGSNNGSGGGGSGSTGSGKGTGDVQIMERFMIDVSMFPVVNEDSLKTILEWGPRPRPLSQASSRDEDETGADYDDETGEEYDDETGEEYDETGEEEEEEDEEEDKDMEEPQDIEESEAEKEPQIEGNARVQKRSFFEDESEVEKNAQVQRRGYLEDEEARIEKEADIQAEADIQEAAEHMEEVEYDEDEMDVEDGVEEEAGIQAEPETLEAAEHTEEGEYKEVEHEEARNNEGAEAEWEDIGEWVAEGDSGAPGDWADSDSDAQAEAYYQRARAEVALNRERSTESPEAPAYELGVETDLSEQMRAALIALTHACARLKPLPSKCSFSIAMELKNEADADPPARHPQPWVPVQPSLQKMGRVGVHNAGDDGAVEESNESGDKMKTGEDLGGVKFTPIRTVETGTFRFETWVEEGRAKSGRPSGQTKAKPKVSFAKKVSFSTGVEEIPTKS
ncbi:hypothetical protein C7974DRAFT_56794 [Boeremia exigua]|uniref:uncharacterized protein n=1 Tax=Boeremia exigua TaxID=749465 RepID=UPI001E8DD661|nr:uncharacterized protein C7974DRAFT_56794 [Boeremia exigua]KAH6614969.1 hypothetical protein C7974DRAFT_56794 [Boeremia exigua]